jgi:hypothetical protein
MLCLLLMLASADPFPLVKEEAELSVGIHEHELRAHVYRLTGEEFLGRKNEGGERAAEHIAKSFERLNLRPAFGESYFQPILASAQANPADAPKTLGRNVGAFIPGADPQLADEWIILSAHFDHLGVRNGKMYPGADDNASGVAMLLEVAEALALSRHRPKRGIYFVAFDLEEVGLIGSKYLAEHPPRPLAQLRTFLVADILGRSMAGVMDDTLFVLGSENSKRLRELVQHLHTENGIVVGRLGADLVGTRSDYGPFRDRKIPFLFFTTGTHRDYHKPTDLPDRLNYEKLARISRWIDGLTRQLADDATPPVWEPDQVPRDMNEVATVRLLLDRTLDNPDIVKLSDNQREQVTVVRDKLKAIEERKTITADERTWLVNTARILMLTVFN